MKFNYEDLRTSIVNKLEFIIAFIVFVILFFTITNLWSYFDLPDKTQVLGIFKEIFDKYGLLLVFFGSIVEATLFLGSYFPGAIVIFLGVSMASGDVFLAFQTVLVAIVGLFIGHNINYFIGKLFFQKVVNYLNFEADINSFEKKIKEKGIFAGFMFYVMPGSGAIFSSTLGLLKYPYYKFIFFITFVLIFWNTIWGVLSYLYGMQIFDLLTSWVSIFLVFFAMAYYMYITGKFDKVIKEL